MQSIHLHWLDWHLLRCVQVSLQFSRHLKYRNHSFCRYWRQFIRFVYPFQQPHVVAISHKYWRSSHSPHYESIDLRYDQNLELFWNWIYCTRIVYLNSKSIPLRVATWRADNPSPFTRFTLAPFLISSWISASDPKRNGSLKFAQ